MYLRIVFLILLCIPVIYVFFLLLSYLIDEILHKEDKRDVHRHDHVDKDDVLFQEYNRRKKRGDFKVIR